MTALIIAASVILVLALLLFLPACADVKTEGGFSLTVKYLGIKIYSTANNKKKEKKQETKSDTTEKSSKSTNFKVIKDRFGFTGAVKYYAKLIGMVVKRTARFISHLKVRKFNLDITVASDNSAKTAIEYGVICTAVYPLISYIETVCDLKHKSINIKTDFDITNPDFHLSCTVKASLIFVALTVLSSIKEYNKITKESELK